MYFKNIDIKIEDEDQALILSCSLLSLYANFVDIMFYGQHDIFLQDVKDAFIYSEF